MCMTGTSATGFSDDNHGGFVLVFRRQLRHYGVLKDNTDNNDNGKNGRNCGCHEVTYNTEN